MTSEIRLFPDATVAESKAVAADGAEPTNSEVDGRFAEGILITLHKLRIELGKSYHVAVNSPGEMP